MKNMIYLIPFIFLSSFPVFADSTPPKFVMGNFSGNDCLEAKDSLLDLAKDFESLLNLSRVGSHVLSTDRAREFEAALHPMLDKVDNEMFQTFAKSIVVALSPASGPSHPLSQIVLNFDREVEVKDIEFRMLRLGGKIANKPLNNYVFEIESNIKLFDHRHAQIDDNRSIVVGAASPAGFQEDVFYLFTFRLRESREEYICLARF